MRTLLSLMLCCVFALGITGCEKKADEGKIPITTSSDEAKKEFMVGRDLAEKLQFTNAMQHFDKAIALDTGFASAYLARANVAFTAKEFFFYLQKALALKERCSEGEQLLILSTEAGTNANIVKQKEYLDKLVALFPNDERVHFNLGGWYFNQQDYQHAIDQYNTSTRILPNYSMPYNMLGYANRSLNNYAEAEKAFKKYIELVPDDPNPYDSYAELLLKMGRFDESIVNYQKALKVDKNFFNSRIGIAADYMYKGESDSGLAEMRKLYDMAQNDGERRQALFTQMVIYIDAGKMDMAMKELEKQFLLGESTNDIAAISGDYGFKGFILQETGNYTDALAAYEKSEQLIASGNFSQGLKDNTKLVLHYNRAAVAADKKDLKTAKAEAEEFRKTAEANKNVNQIHLAHELVGRIAFAEKKYDTAIAELLQTNKQNPYELYRLALAYQASGDKAKAKEFCGKAAKFNGLPGLNYAFIRMKAEKLLSAL
jgi:tetratricopeptide (TPR) repeat protein